MRLSQISYQPKVITNNDVTFQSSAVLKYGRQNIAQGAPVLAASVLALFGIKKRVENSPETVIAQPSLQETVIEPAVTKTIEDIKAEKVTTWKDFLDKVNEMIAVNKERMTKTDSDIQKAEMQKENELLQSVIKNAEKTNKSEIVPAATVGTIIRQIKKEEEKSLRQQKRAEARRQAELEQQAIKTAKRVEKNAQAKKELEKCGYTDIEELSDGSLRFNYQGVSYIIQNDNKQQANLYKSLLRATSDGSLTKGTSIVAPSCGFLYKCDWLFPTQENSVENLLKFINSDSKTLSAKLDLISKLEKIVKEFSDEEMDAYIGKYKCALLTTERGKQYLEGLKSSNPQKYIEIMTPQELFKTESGKNYLKTYAHDKFISEQKRIESMIKNTQEQLALEKLGISEKQYQDDKIRFTYKNSLYRVIIPNNLSISSRQCMIDFAKGNTLPDGVKIVRTLPPASSVEVLNFENKLVKDSKYVPGHWETITPMDINDPRDYADVGTHYVDGYSIAAETKQTLKYRYNGEVRTIYAKNSSKKEMLENLKKEINKNIERVEQANLTANVNCSDNEVTRIRKGSDGVYDVPRYITDPNTRSEIPDGARYRTSWGEVRIKQSYPYCD